MEGIKFQLKREVMTNNLVFPPDQYVFCFSIIIDNSNDESTTVIPLEFGFDRRLGEETASVLSEYVFQLLISNDIIDQFGRLPEELIKKMSIPTNMFLVPKSKESVKELTDNMKKYVENGLKNCMKKNSENPWLESELVMDLDV